MDMGNIQQTGTPLELYNNPKNRFVHSFLGQSNFTHVKIKGGKLTARATAPGWCGRPRGHKGREMLMATRPNTIDINRSEDFAPKSLSGCSAPILWSTWSRWATTSCGFRRPTATSFRGRGVLPAFPQPHVVSAQEEGADEERAKRMIV